MTPRLRVGDSERPSGWSTDHRDGARTPPPPVGASERPMARAGRTRRVGAVGRGPLARTADCSYRPADCSAAGGLETGRRTSHAHLGWKVHSDHLGGEAIADGEIAVPGKVRPRPLRERLARPADQRCTSSISGTAEFTDRFDAAVVVAHNPSELDQRFAAEDARRHRDGTEFTPLVVAAVAPPLDVRRPEEAHRQRAPAQGALSRLYRAEQERTQRRLFASRKTRRVQIETAGVVMTLPWSDTRPRTRARCIAGRDDRLLDRQPRSSHNPLVQILSGDPEVALLHRPALVERTAGHIVRAQNGRNIVALDWAVELSVVNADHQADAGPPLVESVRPRPGPGIGGHYSHRANAARVMDDQVSDADVPHATPMHEIRVRRPENSFSQGCSIRRTLINPPHRHCHTFPLRNGMAIARSRCGQSGELHRTRRNITHTGEHGAFE